MISVLVPTRGRPDGMRRLVESCRRTAVSTAVEFVFYIDSDDPAHSLREAASLAATHGPVTTVSGPRTVLSKAWNLAYAAASPRAEVFMHCGDDIVFRTDGWDTAVEAAFAAIPDRIALVHGRDGVHDHLLATHGFLHRRWVETVGYFVPPYFTSDYNDLWLTQVADRIGRRVYLPTLYTEHMHPAVGKGELDRTHLERLERHRVDGMDDLWQATAEQRQDDVAKLTAAIAAAREETR